MTKIEMLRLMRITGNDQELISLAHEIVSDETELMDNRIEALCKMDRAVGIEYTEHTETDVRDYVADPDTHVTQNRRI